MFGYVKPYKPLLLMRDYTLYKATYCTLCRELGKHYGFFARLILNYDLCFFMLCALNNSPHSPIAEPKHCVVNPCKKCLFIGGNDHLYHKAAALTILFSHHKWQDDIDDESFAKAFKASCLNLFYAPIIKKAARQFPTLATVLAKQMAIQKNLEQNANSDIDTCAEPTATMLSAYFGEIDNNPNWQKLGFFLGKWIYTLDAIDDLAKDSQAGNFNPLLNLMAAQNLSKTELNLQINQLLNHYVYQMQQLLQTMPNSDYMPILENIFNHGLYRMQDKIINGRNE